METIKKIARDVSNKLNITISRDCEDMVGIEAHLEKMQSLLRLDDEDGTMIVGICGPAGIGKTTIARALQSRLSSTFQLTYFMENLRGICKSGLNEYELKPSLENQLLSKFSHQKVLIILDDVDYLQQLGALAAKIKRFHHGSRIIVTAEYQELLEYHGINNIYCVDFPSSEEALEILCRYVYRQSHPRNDFKGLAESVVDLCGKLPLNLRLVGTSLRGKKEGEWAIGESSIWKKSGYSTGMSFLVVINLLLEIASAVSDQLSSTRKPYFTRISLVMSILSLILSILDLIYKIRVHKARFQCKWPIPWFHYPSRGYNRIFGSSTDTFLLFCVVCQLIVSTINCSFTERGRDGPIKVAVWPLVFAIGMVVSKFMEKPTISKESLKKMY